MSEAEALVDDKGKQVGDSKHSDKKILIAIDHSRQAEEAFDWYLDNLHREGNELLLYHVIEPPFVSSQYMGGSGTQMMYMNGEMYTEMLELEKHKVKELEQGFIKKMKERHITGRIKAVFHSRPGEAVIEAAKEEKVRMIVMGTRGLGTVRRTIMGSVSDYVLHHAHCPVVVCRGVHHAEEHKEHKQHKQ